MLSNPEKLVTYIQCEVTIPNCKQNVSSIMSCDDYSLSTFNRLLYD